MNLSQKCFSGLIVVALASTDCFAGDALILKLADAQRGKDLRDNSISVINVHLDDRSRKEFSLWSYDRLGKKFKIMLDGRAVMEGQVFPPSSDGHAQLRGVPDNEIDILIPKLINGQTTVSIESFN